MCLSILFKLNMSCLLTDRSPSRGVYYGDLTYGRVNGNKGFERGKDFTANIGEHGVPNNMPAVRLVLVEPRDPEVWKKDPNIKEAKKRRIDGSQHAINLTMTMFKELYDNGSLRANFKLRTGKSMF